jgi:hypothetical protein
VALQGSAIAIDGTDALLRSEPDRVTSASA